MPAPDPSAAIALPQWIGQRAERHPDRPAVTYVGDDRSEESWSYRELWLRACDVASRLPAVEEANPRGLLLFPPGLEFLAGFLGCQIAGWTPVPTCYPKAGRQLPRLDSAAIDCSPSALLGDRATLDDLPDDKICQAVSSIPRIATDKQASTDGWIDPASLSIDVDSLALLQYTSGSTSEPKGVMIRHRNLMANLEAIRRGFRIDWRDDDDPEPECGVFWLPFFHDMGLIGGILEPLYVGGHAVLLSPRSFLQRPIRWLQCITNYKAGISGAPNFAYQLCIDRISPDQSDELDLSSWKVAFSGAEPINARTLSDFANRFSQYGFSSSAFYPCYGLAEATLLAAGGDGPAPPTVLSVDRKSLGMGEAKVVSNGSSEGQQKLVACGSAAHQTELLVVDPTNSKVLGERRVGEIWLKGAGVSGGYWNRTAENGEMFQAAIVNGKPAERNGDAGYCRTGDFGFMHEGHLYVTGRIKDVVILRGRNLFPQDIEATVRELIGSEGGQCAAFSVDSASGEALAILAEIPRHTEPSTLPDLVRSIRREVIDVHEVDPRHVLLARPATIPLTSSGKVQRSRCRAMFEADEIKCKHRYDRNFANDPTPVALPSLPQEPTSKDRQSMTTMVQKWMSEWLVVHAGIQPGDLDIDKPFGEYGLDSMTAIELSGEIEDWSGVQLTPVVAWNYPTIAKLSGYMVDQIIGTDDSDPELNPGAGDDAELESLLEEIEQMSDDQIDSELAAKRRS